MRRSASEIIRSLERRVARLERQASRSKYARSIPRPPQNRSLVDIKKATKISDQALDAEYGYGLSTPGSFGYEANKFSSLYALDAIMNNLTTAMKNPKDKKLIEVMQFTMDGRMRHIMSMTLDTKHSPKRRLTVSHLLTLLIAHFQRVRKRKIESSLVH